VINVLHMLIGMAGSIYVVGALALGGWFLYSGVQVSLDRTRAKARRVLLTSVIDLPALYALMVLDPVRL